MLYFILLSRTVPRLLPDYGPYVYAFDGNILYTAIKKGDDWTFISS